MLEKRLIKLGYLRRLNGKEFNKVRLCMIEEMIMCQLGNIDREV